MADQDPAALAMYGELAGWFHVLTAPADYAAEARIYFELIEARIRRPLETVLELGSGGGNNASHYKQGRRATLVDLSPGMLELSRSINPECEHLLGDMRTVRLERTFDAVFIHDAVSYITTEDDLAATIETATAHLAPGGVALFVPDNTAENVRERTEHGGHDGPDGRALRYLEWSHRPAPGGVTYVVDYAYMLREPGRATRVVQDRHTCAAFPRATWLRLMAASGLEAEFIERDLVDEDGTWELQMFVGVRPA